jgi:hypothetical protein
VGIKPQRRRKMMRYFSFILILLTLAFVGCKKKSATASMDSHIESFTKLGFLKDARILMGHYYRLKASKPKEATLFAQKLIPVFIKKIGYSKIDGGEKGQMLSSLFFHSKPADGVKKHLEGLIAFLLKNPQKDKNHDILISRSYKKHLVWGLSQYASISYEAEERFNWLTEKFSSIIDEKSQSKVNGFMISELLTAIQEVTATLGKKQKTSFAKLLISLLDEAFDRIENRSSSDSSTIAYYYELIKKGIPLIGKNQVASDEVVMILSKCLFYSHFNKICIKALKNIDSPSLRGKSYDPRPLFLLLSMGNLKYNTLEHILKGNKSKSLDNSKNGGLKEKNPDDSWFKPMVKKYGDKATKLYLSSKAQRMGINNNFNMVFVSALIEMGAKTELEGLFSIRYSPEKLLNNSAYQTDKRNDNSVDDLCKRSKEVKWEAASCPQTKRRFKLDFDNGEFGLLLETSSEIIRSLYLMSSSKVKGAGLLSIVKSLKAIRGPLYTNSILNMIQKKDMNPKLAAAILSLIFQGETSTEWSLAKKYHFTDMRRWGFDYSKAIISMQCSSYTSMATFQKCLKRKQDQGYSTGFNNFLPFCPCFMNLQVLHSLGYLPAEEKTPFKTLQTKIKVLKKVVEECDSIFIRYLDGKLDKTKNIFDMCTPIDSISPYKWNIHKTSLYKGLIDKDVSPHQAEIRLLLSGSEQFRVKLLRKLVAISSPSFLKTFEKISENQLLDVLQKSKESDISHPYCIKSKIDLKRRVTARNLLKKELNQLKSKLNNNPN